MTDETPTPSPRVRRKRSARKERILLAAMQLVAAEGVDRLTLTRVADELDYTPGALYRYFPSKDALLAAMQRKAIVDMQAELADAVANARAAAIEPADAAVSGLLPLCALCERFLSLRESRPHDLALINFLLADPRNLITDDEVSLTAAVFARVLIDVEALLDAAVAGGALAPGAARDRTVMLWTALQSATQLGKMRRFDPTRFDPRNVGRNLYRCLLAGWGADAGALARATSLCQPENDDAGNHH